MKPAARRAFARGILVGALAIAVVANVAEYPAIDREIGTTYASLNRHPTAVPTEIAREHSPTVRERFQLYAELSLWAPGAELLLGPGVVLQRDQLIGLGTVRAVTEWDGAVQLTDDDLARIEAHLVAEGEDRDAGPFALAVIPNDVDQLVTIAHGSRLLIVDGRLLDGLDR